MKPIEVKEEQFNEIVFENRNKDYGAYALRASYKKRMLIAMSISLTAFLLAVSFPLIAGYLNKSHTIIDDKTVGAELYNHPNNNNLPVPLPPLPPTPKDIVNKVRFVAPIISDDDSLDVSFGPDIDSIKNKPIDTTTTPENIPEDPNKNKKTFIDEKINEIWDIQEPPTFPGGDAVWMNIIVQNIQYPVLAKESNISGTVYLKFVVEPNGSITNITLQRGIGGGCDEEAIRVVKMLPNWNPGKQNGKPVRVWFVLPIKFTLQ